VFSLTLSVTVGAPSGLSRSSLEVLAGESLTLYCPLFVTNNSVILWSKSSRIMFAGALRVRMDDRYHVVNDNLLISSVRAEDAGELSCQVEDEKRVLKVFTYTVKVLAPARPVISVGEYLAVKQGTSLALECAAEGVPVPEVTWRRGSQTLARGKGKSTLLLEYVTREDSGELICEADNGIGDIAEDILALDVLFAPAPDAGASHLIPASVRPRAPVRGPLVLRAEGGLDEGRPPSPGHGGSHHLEPGQPPRPPDLKM